MSFDLLLFVPPIPALLGPTPSLCGEFVLPVPAALLVPAAVFAFAGLLVLVVVVPQAQTKAAVNKIKRAMARRISESPV